MDYRELDQRLHALNPLEADIKNQTGGPDYSIYDTKMVNDHLCYIEQARNDGLFPNSCHPNIIMTRHTRFIPTHLHVHTWIEMVYVYSGSCGMEINQKKYRLRDGQLLILDSEAAHSIDTTGENDIILNFLMDKAYFTAAFFNRFSSNNILSCFLLDALSEEKQHNEYLIFHSQDSRRLPIYARELAIEFLEPSINCQSVIDHLISLVFLELIRILEASDTSANSKFDNNLVPVLKYISQNYRTCTLNETAEYFHMNSNYLTTLLKKQTGNSFKELVQNQRMQIAVNYLRTTSFPIEVIAREIGYTNTTYFYKKFKKTYGVSPKEYREAEIPPAPQGAFIHHI